MTMRTIECLAAKTCILTTNRNKEMKEIGHCFYFDRNSPNLDQLDFNIKFSDELIMQFSLKQWVKSLIE